MIFVVCTPQSSMRTPNNQLNFTKNFLTSTSNFLTSTSNFLHCIFQLTDPIYQRTSDSHFQLPHSARDFKPPLLPKNIFPTSTSWFSHCNFRLDSSNVSERGEESIVVWCRFSVIPSFCDVSHGCVPSNFSRHPAWCRFLVTLFVTFFTVVC